MEETVQVQSRTERAVAFWAASWIDGDRAAARRMLADDVEVEWNLDAPVDDERALSTLDRIATAAMSVTVMSRVCTGDRALTVYDCETPGATVRVVELITVAQGRIVHLRQVHDPVALARHLLALITPS
jgi:hypothetical protein